MIDDRVVAASGGGDRVVGQDHDVVDRDGASSAAEAKQVEVEGGEGAGGDASQVYLNRARGAESDRVTSGLGACDFHFVAEVGLSGVLQVEEGIGLGEAICRADEGLQGTGIEQGGFKGITGGEGAAIEVGSSNGKLQSFGVFWDEEGLGEVSEEGRVFAQDGLTIKNLGVTASIPIRDGGLVKAAVGDANQGNGLEWSLQRCLPISPSPHLPISLPDSLKDLQI